MSVLLHPDLHHHSHQICADRRRCLGFSGILCHYLGVGQRCLIWQVKHVPEKSADFV